MTQSPAVFSFQRRAYAPVVSPQSVALRLSTFNRDRFKPGLDVSPAARAAAEAREWFIRDVELDFLDAELERVRGRAAKAPTDSEGFLAWFEGLRESGPGQNDPLFDWLASEAPIGAMRWFLRQEITSEGGFDDLVALTQVRMPPRVKLELARSYWDEMGQGHRSAMHGPMLSSLAESLGLEDDEDSSSEIVWEAVALSNLMVGLAAHRAHAFRSIGALGVVGLTAPARAAKVNEGLARLGIDAETRRYYALLAALDAKHSASWNREVLAPLVASDGRIPCAIAEGALARLVAGERCYRRYGRALGVPGLPH